jgi:hypothetical protein
MMINDEISRKFSRFDAWLTEPGIPARARAPYRRLQRD